MESLFLCPTLHLTRQTSSSTLEENIPFNMYPCIILYVRRISTSVLGAVTPCCISQCSRDMKSKITKAHVQNSKN